MSPHCFLLARFVRVEPVAGLPPVIFESGVRFNHDPALDSAPPCLKGTDQSV
jgi:hypothetical protein